MEIFQKIDIEILQRLEENRDSERRVTTLRAHFSSSWYWDCKKALTLSTEITESAIEEQRERKIKVRVLGFERERERVFVFDGRENGEGFESFYGRNYGSNLPTQVCSLAEDCHVKSRINFLD